MRKDKAFGKDISLYSKYAVEGRNISALLNILANKNINVYRVKTISDKKVVVSVKYCDGEKFFAISKELCYNVKKIKDYGALFPLLFIKKNVGVLIGALIFAVCAYISNDYIFNISFIGSGSVYEKEIVEELKENGVCLYKKFSSFDLNSIADSVLKNNGNVVFLSLKKQGNTLIVNSEKRNVPDINFEKKEKLLSTVSGVVESITVYRGTATVEVGSFVNIGDLLIDGNMTIKEQTVYTGVIGKITILTEEKFTFIAEDKKENEVLLLAKEILNRETVFEDITKEEADGGFLYTVSLKYRTEISAG